MHVPCSLLCDLHVHCVFMAPFTLLFVDYDGSGAAENKWSEPPPPWPCTSYSDDKANHALCLLVFKRMFSTVTVPLQLGLVLAQQFKIAWSYNSCKYTIKINVKYTQSWWEIIMELKNHSKSELWVIRWRGYVVNSDNVTCMFTVHCWRCKVIAIKVET